MIDINNIVSVEFSNYNIEDAASLVIEKYLINF